MDGDLGEMARHGDTTTKVMFNLSFGKPDNNHNNVIVYCSLNLFRFFIYCISSDVFDEDGNPVESDAEDDPDFDPT